MSYGKGIATGASLCAFLVLLVANGMPQQNSFKTIDVERINVREPDGTLRMVISNRTSFPGQFWKNKEHPRPDRRHAAGMLFINDEGTENGGLIFAGKKTDKGPSAGASLTFDRFEQDQVIQLLQNENGKNSMAGIIFSDRPENPMNIDALNRLNAAKTQEEADAVAREANIGGAPRMFMGRSVDRNSVVMLQDAKGTPRLMLMVKPDGEASIQFLNEKGEPTKTISPE
jgi:hypothetical protein